VLSVVNQGGLMKVVTALPVEGTGTTGVWTGTPVAGREQIDDEVGERLGQLLVTPTGGLAAEGVADWQ